MEKIGRQSENGRMREREEEEAQCDEEGGKERERVKSKGLRRLMFWNVSAERVDVVKINPVVPGSVVREQQEQPRNSKTAQWLVYAFPK